VSLVQATQVWLALQCGAPVPMQLVSERHWTHTLVPGSQYGVGRAQVPLFAQEEPLASPPPPDEAASVPPDEEGLPPSLGPPLEDVLEPPPELLPDDPSEPVVDPPSGSETALLLPEPPHPIPIAMTTEAEASPLEKRIRPPARLTNPSAGSAATVQSIRCLGGRCSRHAIAMSIVFCSRRSRRCES